MDESSSEPERVRVVVRVRPRNEREEQQELGADSLHVLNVNDTNGQIYVCKRKNEREIDRELRCTYDRVFGELSTQQEVFEYLQDSVQQVAQGFNCTMFAYGQTGTGKTHTMLGKDVEKYFASSTSNDSTTITASPAQWGVIPRAIESLFEELRSISLHGASGVVHCSYMQIYNNDVFDLLQANKQRMKEPLPVREMIKGNAKHVFVSGLSEFRVTNLEETMKLLKLGNKNRTIRATEYNERSSRSHALLQLSTEVESRGLEGATTIIRRAKLSLVDLAGSEKWGTDPAMMGVDRCKELTSINQSLSALGNVISALTNPKRTHIPYRDSKLTRLLQDSLGGNTRTVVIATISPAMASLEETISTLQFADRAKSVMVRVKVNELVDDAILLAQAQREIARLKLLLKQTDTHQRIAELEKQVARLTTENAVLIQENKKLKQRAAKTNNNAAVITEPSIAVNGTADNSTLNVVKPTPTTHLTQEPIAAGPVTLQLNELRLDLISMDSPPRNKPKGAFMDEESDMTGGTVLDGVGKEQERVLHEIQSERRELERQLDRIAQHSARHHGETDEDQMTRTGNGNKASNDEEHCPICGRIIDFHSDAELDECIDREMELMARQSSAQPSEHQNQHSNTPQDGVVSTSSATKSNPPEETNQYSSHGQPHNTIASDSSPPHPVIGPPPLKRASSSADRRPSPYLQDLALKPRTPLQARSLGKRRSLRDMASGSSSTGESAKAAPTVGPHRGVVEAGKQRSPSSRLFNDLNTPNNQTDADGNATPPIPILHQGHKSVKALKKLHATSPYSFNNRKQLPLEKRNNLPPSTNSSHIATGNNANNHPSQNQQTSNTNEINKTLNVVTNSVRDIGLMLTVYKFRYDCWYPCTIVGYDGKRKLHCCQYEYGDKQWQDLSQRKVQIVGRSNPNGDSD